MSTSTSLITGVDFVFLPTKDFAAASRFYGEQLGLPCTARYGRVPGGEFQAGQLTLQVIESEAIGRTFQPSRDPIAFRVDDVQAARRELEARGVSFSAETIDSGVCHMALFEDADGNALMLHHRYAPPSPAG
jgi:predicted enzyme related to lactoylglutathione lyase